MTSRQSAATTRKRYSEPTDQEREQAKAFGAWQTDARKSKGLTISSLAQASGYSYTQVHLLDGEGKAGIDPNGRYRSPSRAYIEAIARATGASITGGRKAAGLDRPPENLPDNNAAVQLSTGDWILLREDDAAPEVTVAAVDSFVRAWRENMERFSLPRRVSDE